MHIQIKNISFGYVPAFYKEDEMVLKGEVNLTISDCLGSIGRCYIDVSKDYSISVESLPKEIKQKFDELYNEIEKYIKQITKKYDE
jgi:hypothetical protein